MSVIEWEIIYEVFAYLSSEDDGYWAPELMGCTALIMIVGFHLLAKSNPNNLAVRIVKASVQVLIPLYLIGIGSLIAAIMYAGGLGGMVEAPLELTLGTLPQAIEGNWLDTLFESITNPVAILVLALGIGGLAIVNIFVAHHLIIMIGNNLSDLSSRFIRAKEAVKCHATIKRTQRDASKLLLKLEKLNDRDDHSIRLMISNEVMAVISEALHPHKVWLNEQSIRKDSRFKEEDINAEQVAKNIAEIESVSINDVMAALNPKLLESK